MKRINLNFGPDQLNSSKADNQDQLLRNGLDKGDKIVGSNDAINLEM